MDKQISWISIADSSGVDIRHLRKDLDQAVENILEQHGVEPDSFIVAVFDRGAGRGDVARMVKRLLGSRTLNSKGFIYQVARKDPVGAQKIAKIHEEVMERLKKLNEALVKLVWAERGPKAQKSLKSHFGSQPVRKADKTKEVS